MYIDIIKQLENINLELTIPILSLLFKLIFNVNEISVTYLNNINLNFLLIEIVYL